jgi:hypothetical protein
MQKTANTACDESFTTIETMIKTAVKDVKKQVYVALLWISFSVLFIALIQFLPIWYQSRVLPFMNLFIAVFFGASVIVYAIVGYVWFKFIKPQAQVHVINDIRAPRQSFLNKVFDLQKDLKEHKENSRVQPLYLLILVFVSIGLALSSVLTWFCQFFQYHYGIQTFVPYFGSLLNGYFFPTGPVCIIVALAFAAFVLFITIPNSIEQLFLDLLAVPTALSLFVVLLQFYNNAPRWWQELVISYSSASVVLTSYFFMFAEVLVLSVSILLIIVIYGVFIDLKDFYKCIDDQRITCIDGQRITCIDKMVALLPKRVRVNSSYPLLFSTKLSSAFLSRERAVRNALQMSGINQAVHHLEIELQAAGIDFDKAKKHVALRESSEVIITAWNCKFGAPGTQTINIVLNAVSGGGSDRYPIFVDSHEVTVDNLFTASWLPILVAVVPIVTAVITALLH